MKKIYLFLVTSLLMSTLSVSYADKLIHQHWCFPPEKPLFSIFNSFQNQYKKDLLSYQQCLLNYIQEQNKAIVTHQKSINKTFKELKQSTFNNKH